MLAAMDTMGDDHLSNIVLMPVELKEEMRMKYKDYRKQWIIYWLETSSYASWSQLGGGCLYFNKEQALANIRSFIKTDEGNVYIYIGRSFYRARV